MDTFCCICGNSCYGGDYDYLSFTIDEPKDIKDIANKIKWINKPAITLYSNNKNKKEKVNAETYLPFIDMYDSYDYGVFIHYDCWKFVKITYGIELKYNNLPVNYIDLQKKKTLNDIVGMLKINYGEITKYWHQDFDFHKINEDKNTWMLESPLNTSNVKNINRIKKIIAQFKFKKELRPSPPISATFYKINDIKIGNNNKFWIIKNNKWNEIKDDIIKKKYTFDSKNKLLYKIMLIPRIGEYSKFPLFINNYKETKKNLIVEILGTELTINNFEKLYIK
jgi:hypothetical protein